MTGLAGIAKVILASEHNVLPSNLHYKIPHPDIPALHDGRIQVVDKATRWEGGTTGVSAFGFGGANVHAILQSEEKCIQGQHDSSKRLAVCSGRTKEWVEEVLNLAIQHQADLGFHALLDGQLNSSRKMLAFRAYTVLNGNGEIYTQVNFTYIIAYHNFNIQILEQF